MPTYDLSGYLADDALTLQGVVSEKHPRGKTYTIASPSAKVGLQLRRAMQIWGQHGADGPPSADDLKDLVELATDDNGDPIDFHVKLMGDTYQQMVDDGVSADRLAMISDIVITHYGHGAALAQLMVEAASELAQLMVEAASEDGPGEAPARGNRATRRTAKKTAGSRSRKASTAGTGSGRATARRTSGSSTSPDGPEGSAQAV